MKVQRYVLRSSRDDGMLLLLDSGLPCLTTDIFGFSSTTGVLVPRRLGIIGRTTPIVASIAF